MKLIVGLGNPGTAYVGSPHNAGFEAVDQLAERFGCEFQGSRKFKSDLAKVDVNGDAVTLMKPLTFMNLSGEAVGPWLRWHRLGVDALVVLLDDVDLPLGRLRIRPKGGSGGHNGLTSVIQHVGSNAFVRVRLGVGRGEGEQDDVIKHVLRPLTGPRREAASLMVERAADAVAMILGDGVERAMNRFNAIAGGADKTESQKQESGH